MSNLTDFITNFRSAGVSGLGNSLGTTGMASQQIVFAGGNNVTLSQSVTNGSATITISAGNGIQGSNTLGMSNLGNTSGTTGVVSGSQLQLALAGGNNVTLSQSINGSSATVTISAANQTQESNTLGMSNLGNTSGTSGVVSGNQVRMLLAGGNNVTLSQSVNGVSATITISAASQSAGSDTFGMSNLGNTSGTSGVVSGDQVRFLLAGGNNVTLSQSVNGSSGTLTISAANQTVQTQNLFDVTISGNTAGAGALISSGTLSLAGGNNITISQAGNAITISGPNVGGAQTGISGIVVSNTTYTSGTVSFSNANGISFGSSAGQAITASYTVPTVTAGSDTLGMSNIGNTSGTSGVVSGDSVQLLFAGGNNVTLSQSLNGRSGTITISAFNQTVESQTLGMSNIGNTSGTSGVVSAGQVRMLFAGGNNITLSQSLNGASGTITISAFNQTAESNTLGMSNLGNTSGTTGVISGNQLQLALAGGNNITLSQSINGSSATITISAGAGGAAGSNTLGMSNLGNTSGTTGVISGSALQLALAGGNNVTLSQSVNGSSATITISQYDPIMSVFLPWPNISLTQTGLSVFFNDACLSLAPFNVQQPLSITRIDQFMSISMSTSSNSSYAQTLSISLGIFSISGSSLSLVSSGSVSYNISNTSNNQTSIFSGFRAVSIPINANLKQGYYVLGMWTQSSTTNANWATVSLMINKAFTINPAVGYLGSATNASIPLMPGFGFYNSAISFTTAMPNSIAFSSIGGYQSLYPFVNMYATYVS